jgi:Flp pilus assembly protein TadB
MFLAVNPLNVLLGALFGAGVFALTAGLLYRQPIALSNVERLYGGGEERGGLMRRLQRELDAARFHLTAAEFLRISALLAALSGVGAYLLTEGLLPALLAAGLGGSAYWFYLTHKADRAIEAYEEQLPQAVSALITGARLGGDLQQAAEYAATRGPSAGREDWAYIAAQLRAGGRAHLDQIFQTVAQKRGSQLLNSLFELLLMLAQEGAPLSETLPPLQATLAERVKTLRAARTRLSGPLRELWIVCAAPIVGVVVARYLSPQFAEIYRSWAGQLLILIAWGVDLTVFALAYRAFSADLRRETNFYGALKGQARSAPLSFAPGAATLHASLSAVLESAPSKRGPA